MTIELSLEAQRLLQDRMRRGGYASEEQAVVAGLASLEQQEKLGEFAPRELEGLLKVAEEEVARGEVLDGEGVFEEIREMSKRHREGGR